MKIRTLALATVCAATAFAAAPAMAANWDRVDSVNISHGADRDSASPDFGGPVERLRFTARDSGVQCAAINAVFGNGQRTQLFSGNIPQGGSRTVDVPGAQRNISRLNFRCHAVGGGDAKVIIEADAGQYRSVWLRSPNWARLWAAVVGNMDENVNYWVQMGRETFTGRNDREATYGGWAGRSVHSIGLRPVNDDARCSRVRATFANGNTQDLDTGGLLREDRTTRIDLPGGDRNITRLVLKCHAEHGRSVTINIFANK